MYVALISWGDPLDTTGSLEWEKLPHLLSKADLEMCSIAPWDLSPLGLESQGNRFSESVLAHRVPSLTMSHFCLAAGPLAGAIVNPALLM